MRTFAIGWRNATLLVLASATLMGVIAYFAWGRTDPAAMAEMQQAGRVLFLREWAANDPQAHGDGLGPVFNANSCLACHSQGGIGGGGDAAHNVTGYEVQPTVSDRSLHKGLLHAFAVDKSFAETPALLQKCFPIIPGGDRVVGNCTVRLADFNPVRIESTNSIALFGDGLIDRLSESTVRFKYAGRLVSQVGREFGGEFNHIPAGRPRTLPDGRLGKFGWKAQFATLREFVAAACANELGLGNPLMQQAKPLGHDYQCDKPDLTRQEFRQLVAFVEAIPRPVEVPPADARQRARAEKGKNIFRSIGCAECHTPDLGDVAGVYSDLLLHSLTSPASDGYKHEILVEIPLPDSHPKADEWRTPPLWGVADSAPYFHDGASPTLETAIQRHEGDANPVMKVYKELPREDQLCLLVFLKTLQAPAAAQPPNPRPAANAVAANK
jgi:mono/diheme cytochrome c family protein